MKENEYQDLIYNIESKKEYLFLFELSNIINNINKNIIFWIDLNVI